MTDAGTRCYLARQRTSHWGRRPVVAASSSAEVGGRRLTAEPASPVSPVATPPLLSSATAAGGGTRTLLPTRVLSFSVVAADVPASLQVFSLRALRPPAAPAPGPSAAQEDVCFVLTHRLGLDTEGAAPPLASGVLADVRPPEGLPWPRATLLLQLLAHVVDADGAGDTSLYPHWSADAVTSGAPNAVLADLARQFRQAGIVGAAATATSVAGAPLLPPHLAVAHRLVRLAAAMPRAAAVT
jgi:hypothetical protein